MLAETVLEEALIRSELALACADAGIDAATVVVWVVAATRPEGTTPVAYLQPAGLVLPDTVRVFRAVGEERAVHYRGRAHRLALWGDLPRIPECALGSMLRHELEHARRWERSGPRFFEADDLLRAAVRRAGGAGYHALPSELEANAASAAYAAGTLSPAQLASLAASDELEGLLRRDPPPADVVEATLGELARRDGWAIEGDRARYLEDVRDACRAWDAAAWELEGWELETGGPVIETVAPTG